jgi:hypothetical protein
MEEKQYSVGANLLQEIVNYLGSRPYAEVGNLVNKIISLAQSQTAQPPVEVVEENDGTAKA